MSRNGHPKQPVSSSPTQTDPPAETWLLGMLLVLLVAYLTPFFLSQELAVDGLVYANIAMRLAAGEGGLWSLPQFSGTDQVFTDHPPLGIYALSLWMQWLGTSTPGVEKGFSAVLSLVVIALIVVLARREQRSGALPVLLFLCVPIATYTLKNNFLETQICILYLVACLAALRAWSTPVWGIVVGLCALFGCLIKGPVGLLPLLIPAALWLQHRDLGRATLIGAIILGTLLLGAAILWYAVDGVARAAEFYWHKQVFASITGERPVQHGRDYLLWHALVSTAVMLAVALLVARPSFVPRASAAPGYQKFWGVMCLAALLPLLLSARHYRHYLLPVLPFMALFISGWLTPHRWLLALYQWRGVIACACTALLLVQLVRHWDQTGDRKADIEAAALLAQYVDDVAFCNDERVLHLRLYSYRLHRIRSRVDAANPAEIVCATSPGPDYLSLQILAPGITLFARKDERR
ncbi:MAG: hypothetical protein AAF513_12360 [Pseudomonadota bacterium]